MGDLRSKSPTNQHFPDILYEHLLADGAGTASLSRPAAPPFLAAILVFVAVLAVGVLRRWRWVFWLVMVAFGMSIFAIPSIALQTAGVISPAIPLWYGLLRMLASALELPIAVWMFRLYRQSGVWGERSRASR